MATKVEKIFEVNRKLIVVICLMKITARFLEILNPCWPYLQWVLLKKDLKSLNLLKSLAIETLKNDIIIHHKIQNNVENVIFGVQLWLASSFKIILHFTYDFEFPCSIIRKHKVYSNWHFKPYRIGMRMRNRRVCEGHEDPW